MAVLCATMGEMQWTHFALDTLIAPNLSKLTLCGADELPTQEKLLPEFLLNSIWTVKYRDHIKKNALNLIRHIDHGAITYTAGRACLLDYLADKPGRRVSAYFNAVSYFESHVAHLNMARWLAMRIARPEQQGLFTKNSGCFDERLQEINNQIKHLHSKVTDGVLREEQTISMWLSNTGLESERWKVSFSELAGSLKDCYGVARVITQELPKKIAAPRTPP